MPSYAYEIDDIDDDQVLITRDDIEAEKDTEELFAIRRGLEDRDDILTMQVEAYRLNPLHDRESLLWFRRVCMAKAAAGIGLTHVKKRLIALGAIPDPRDHMVTQLQQKIIGYKAEIATLKERLGEE